MRLEQHLVKTSKESYYSDFLEQLSKDGDFGGLYEINIPVLEEYMAL